MHSVDRRQARLGRAGDGPPHPTSPAEPAHARRGTGSPHTKPGTA